MPRRRVKQHALHLREALVIAVHMGVVEHDQRWPPSLLKQVRVGDAADHAHLLACAESHVVEVARLRFAASIRRSPILVQRRLSARQPLRQQLWHWPLAWILSEPWERPRPSGKRLRPTFRHSHPHGRAGIGQLENGHRAVHLRRLLFERLRCCRRFLDQRGILLRASSSCVTACSQHRRRGRQSPPSLPFFLRMAAMRRVVTTSSHVCRW